MAISAAGGATTFYGDLSEFDIIPVKPENADLFGYGWNIGLSKDIMNGLRLKATYESGYLVGGRLPGKESVMVDFKTNYRGGLFQAEYDLLNALSKKEALQRRGYIDFQAGVGMLLYRSVSYWSDSGRAREYVGYTEPEETLSDNRKELLAEADRLQTITVPVGVTLGYRINYKTDLFVNATLHNTFTDELDTWTRDWTALDKYSLVSVGARFNMNRNEADYPDKKKRKKKSKKNKDADVDTNSDTGANVGGSNSIFGRYQSQKENTTQQANGDSGLDMLTLQLQMFELQMKLFEMFYLEKK